MQKLYNKLFIFRKPCINNNPIGLIIERLHSYTITNMYKIKDFIYTSKNLFKKLIEQNQYPTIINNAINKFTKKHQTNFSIINKTINQLLKQCMENIKK
jgi:hypothetical protein